MLLPSPFLLWEMPLSHVMIINLPPCFRFLLPFVLFGPKGVSGQQSRRQYMDGNLVATNMSLSPLPPPGSIANQASFFLFFSFHLGSFTTRHHIFCLAL